MMGYQIINKHISEISAGDTVEHNGQLMTVCASDIKSNPLLGTLLFGDSYRIGTVPVRKVKFHEPPLPCLQNTLDSSA